MGLPSCGVIGIEESSHITNSIGYLQGRYETEENYQCCLLRVRKCVNFDHGGSLEAAQRCCKSYPDDSAESSFTNSESQAEQHSDEAEVDGGSSLSTELAVVRSSEEINTERHRQIGSNGEDRLTQSQLGSTYPASTINLPRSELTHT